MRCCATCAHWQPTEMDIYVPNAQPHDERRIAAEAEMLRATHALCTWPGTPEAAAFFALSPPWIQKSHAAAGTLTDETEGADCRCWQMRTPAEIPTRKDAA